MDVCIYTSCRWARSSPVSYSYAPKQWERRLRANP